MSVFVRELFFLEFNKIREILAERVLKIRPYCFLQLIVKRCPQPLTFRFFQIRPMSRDFLQKIGQISNLAPKVKSSF